jgi:signal transduction histidine kinase
MRRVLFAIVVALSLATTLLAAEMNLPAFVFEHLMVIAVAATAVIGGVGPAITVAAIGGAGDNILLREPIGQPAITGFRDAIDLALYLGVALTVGRLADGLRAARAKALDLARREREAREALDRLIATVSHDLGTPLTAIQGTIQFARKHPALAEVDFGRLLSRIETAATRAASLVRTLADSKSIEEQTLSLDLRSVDLRGIVEPIARMLGVASDRHPITVASPAGPVMVTADRERLGRVVENLIANAIKYSPAGGAVEVQVRHEDGKALLSVRDHGIGVSAQERPRLFELGYRTPDAERVAPGLGLGLYTTAEIVRRHGGTIDVTSPFGGGTMFTVRLPLAEAPLARAPHAPAHVGARRR